MASVNVSERLPSIVTHEGGAAVHISPEQQLRRSVMSCLLWEKEFYEEGAAIASRIEEYAAAVPPATLAKLAIEARQKMHLRHVPLLLLNTLTRTGAGSRIVADTFPEVIRRADELGEFMAIYWKDGKHPLSAGTKKGLARAFANFDAYQLTKYKGDGKVRLRDVMFLTHPKPGEDRAALYKSLADDTATAPDTWEVALSGGADKKATFERLLREGNLGYLALLRNLKGMAAASVDESLIREAIVARKGAGNVLPFRYIAALRAAPQFASELDAALCIAAEQLPVLSGKTAILVDVSASMDAALSGKSDMTRIDAACALATFARGSKRVFSFSTKMVEVPAFPGLAGIDAIRNSQQHGGTYLGAALNTLYGIGEFDRIIVITDEQSADSVPAPKGKGYMINVASARNGVGYGAWTHIDGFSENVIRYISEREANA
jgi:60 kDa SS-A/Ro ribonucleoprotein